MVRPTRPLQRGLPCEFNPGPRCSGLMQNLVFEEEAQGGGTEGRRVTESPPARKGGKLRGQGELRKPPSYTLAMAEPTTVDPGSGAAAFILIL